MSWLTRLGFVAEQPGGDAAALLARALRGDAAALGLLYRRESGPVYRYALALCGDEAAALDAMQEAFSQLLAQPAQYQPGRGSLGAYLAGIARHQLLARFREARRWVAWEEAASDDDQDQDRAPALGAGSAPGLDVLCSRSQHEQQLWAEIRRLPWSQREALVLVDLQERSYLEAAQVAGVSVEALRTRLHRARHRLAARLNPGGVQGEPDA